MGCNVILDLIAKMSLFCVVSTFVMCILFNIILPSGDVGSDLNLMYQTLNFDLGDSLELEGCKSCYHKTEKDVYYSEKELTSNECKTCLYDQFLNCGSHLQILKKVEELKRDVYTCSSNETFRGTYCFRKIFFFPFSNGHAPGR